MTAIDVLRLKAKLASAEHLVSRVNDHLVKRPDDTQMREASTLLGEAVSRLRLQIVDIESGIRPSTRSPAHRPTLQ